MNLGGREHEYDNGDDDDDDDDEDVHILPKVRISYPKVRTYCPKVHGHTILYMQVDGLLQPQPRIPATTPHPHDTMEGNHHC